MKNRPYVICHMVMSKNGKVTGAFLNSKECKIGIDEYYRMHRKSEATAFACGRETMESSFTNYRVIDLSKYKVKEISKEDFIADKKCNNYAISFDRRGKVGWISSYLSDGDPGYDRRHIIEVVCENANPCYLAYLQSIGVSYIFAGKEEMDISLALQKLKRYFEINIILLEGGSIINTAFENEKLIDELSIVIVPVNGEKEDKCFFETKEIRNYKLVEEKYIDKDTKYVKYVVCK